MQGSGSLLMAACGSASVVGLQWCAWHITKHDDPMVYHHAKPNISQSANSTINMLASHLNVAEYGTSMEARSCPHSLHDALSIGHPWLLYTQAGRRRHINPAWDIGDGTSQLRRKALLKSSDLSGPGMMEGVHILRHKDGWTKGYQRITGRS